MAGLGFEPQPSWPQVFLLLNISPRQLPTPEWAGAGRPLGGPDGGAHLDARLAEVDAPGQLLAHEGVGVVRALEHALQRLQLAAVERGAVPALLLLPLGGAAAPGAGTLPCGSAGQRVSRAGDGAVGAQSPPDRPGRPCTVKLGQSLGTCSAVCIEFFVFKKIYKYCY